MRLAPLFVALLPAMALLLLVDCADGDPPGATPRETGEATAENRITEEGGNEEKTLDPDFSLTREELEAVVSGLPPSIQERVLEEPEHFLDLASQLLREPPELLWLVDKEHPLPASYAPEDLLMLDPYQGELSLTREDLSLREMIMEDLFAMVEAAREEGVELPVSSTYRSYDYQEWLFNYWVEELGLEEAERSSARPGTSQHQLGTTIDFGSISDAFADTEAGLWLAENSWRFGFSLSYPDGYEELTGYKYESWHFRYIGRPAAEMERTFFGGVQQHMLEFWENRKETLARAWRNSVAQEPPVATDGEDLGDE